MGRLGLEGMFAKERRIHEGDMSNNGGVVELREEAK